MRRRAAVLAVLAGAALAVPAAPAAAAACPQGAGVTVVVDFASLGGGTQTGCASGDPSSGLAALRATGHTPTRAAQQPGYFLCRIDGKPAKDPCQRTSPANAYWSYWHAKPGGSWTYSDLGPADYDPPPGTVEGWAFGAGKPPSSPPPKGAPAASPSPKPRSAAPATPTSAPRTSPRASSPKAVTVTLPTAVSAAPPASGTAAAPLAIETPAASPTATDDTADGVTSRVGVGLNDSGPGPGFVIGMGVLLALVLAALVVAARRRQERP